MHKLAHGTIYSCMKQQPHCLMILHQSTMLVKAAWLRSLHQRRVRFIPTKPTTVAAAPSNMTTRYLQRPDRPSVWRPSLGLHLCKMEQKELGLRD